MNRSIKQINKRNKQKKGPLPKATSTDVHARTPQQKRYATLTVYLINFILSVQYYFCVPNECAGMQR